MNRSLLLFYYYKVYWFINLRRILRKFKFEDSDRFTIGITTFMDRYSIFRDLLMRLVYSFPDNEIIIAVNGHYESSLQKEYLTNIEVFCMQFSNVKTIIFKEPQGLSKMWNQILISSSGNKVFLFNDDVLFKRDIRNKIFESGILFERIALIDNSFSHFLIDKTIIKSVGWFDERFTEIGGEDDDFHVRLELENIPLKRYRLNLFRSYKPPLRFNSYGKKVSEQEGGYSTVNSNFLLKKWEISDKRFDGAINIVKSQGNFWKLKPGMETPDFYNNCKY